MYLDSDDLKKTKIKYDSPKWIVAIVYTIYSHLFNKRGGGAKVAKSLNVEGGGWDFLEKTST